MKRILFSIIIQNRILLLIIIAVAALIAQGLYKTGESRVEQVVSLSDARLYKSVSGYLGIIAAMFFFSAVLATAMIAKKKNAKTVGVICAALFPQVYIAFYSLLHGFLPIETYFSLEFFRGTIGYDSDFARNLQDSGLPLAVIRLLDIGNPSAILTSFIAVGIFLFCFLFFGEANKGEVSLSEKTGTKEMNIYAKLGIVVALMTVVGMVVVLKHGGASSCYSISPQPTLESQAAVSFAPATVVGQGKPVLLELGADKCVPCKMMMPVLKELSEQYPQQFTVAFHDVWKDSSVGDKYGISVIPTQIFFDKDGKELFRHEGFFAKEDILAKWKELGVVSVQ